MRLIQFNRGCYLHQFTSFLSQLTNSICSFFFFFPTEYLHDARNKAAVRVRTRKQHFLDVVYQTSGCISFVVSQSVIYEIIVLLQPRFALTIETSPKRKYESFKREIFGDFYAVPN